MAEGCEGQPGDGRPCLLGGPRPVVPPGLFSPESAEEHADGKEGEACIDEIVGDVEFFISNGPIGTRRRLLFDEEQVDGHQRCRTKYGVCEHIDDDVRGEPWALKGWHQRLVVDLRLEQVHADEHQGENRGKRQYPLVSPARIDSDTRQWQEERIPEARLSHRAQWRTLQGDPHGEDE